MKTEGCLLPCLWVKIKDFGLSYGVHDGTPLFLAVNVPFYGALTEILIKETLLFLFLGLISTGLLSTAY